MQDDYGPAYYDHFYDNDYNMEQLNQKIEVNSESLTELEKNVLDEFILDIKNIEAVIPLHEENSLARYEDEYGPGAFFELLKAHKDYIMINGELNKEQSVKLMDFLS